MLFNDAVSYYDYVRTTASVTDESMNECVRKIGETVMVGESKVLGEKCPLATSYTIKFTRTRLGLNPALRDEVSD